ncbi:hypothetical protein [Aegicerativicinus sediminis]|uniref:hypothetical protein n=1 Tax=Aegicerativicinus sediminis TaxID=2893202 RepID=UPI001E58569E|nr:hypothetical protein [Aegicerativicinus sediminis]
MNITASPLNSKVIAKYEVNIGTLYIFDNYVVGEYKDGLHVTFDDYEDVRDKIEKHFDDKPFGFIANRINSYSLEITEGPKFKKAFPNLMAYAVIAYTHQTKRNVELENHFYLFNRCCFDNLLEGEEWVSEQLRELTSSDVS